MKKPPYCPPNRELQYVDETNLYYQMAKKYAEENSLDPAHKTGAVIVKNNLVIGEGANGSTFHVKNGCERKRQNIPTGQGYDLCEGCAPVNHAEQKAIADCLKQGNNPENADLYLYGHWWCCESCWGAMISAKIKNVYLVED